MIAIHVQTVILHLVVVHAPRHSALRYRRKYRGGKNATRIDKLIRHCFLTGEFGQTRGSVSYIFCIKRAQFRRKTFPSPCEDTGNDKVVIARSEATWQSMRLLHFVRNDITRTSTYLWRWPDLGYIFVLTDNPCCLTELRA